VAKRPPSSDHRASSGGMTGSTSEHHPCRLEFVAEVLTTFRRLIASAYAARSMSATLRAGVHSDCSSDARQELADSLSAECGLKGAPKGS